jgi:hypothetical protein
MKGSTSRWTTAIAAAALLGVPAAAFAQPPAQQPTQTQTTTSQPPTSASQPPATSSQPPTSAQPPATSQPPTSTAGSEQQPPAQSTAAQGDTSVAKKALSDARDTLAQLASMPEAAKLQGDQRTQVSQLISNFNELITTQTNWKDSYSKVEASLNSLIGPENGSAPEPSTAGSMAGTAGTTGSGSTAPTGTAGSTANPAGSAAAAAGAAASGQLDPAIRAKLVEFRTHLKAFEQAAGGGSESSAPASESSASSMSNPPSNPSSAASASTPSTPETSAATTSQSAQPSTPPSTPPAGAGTQSAVGTSGTSAPTATDARTSESQTQANRELDAIQAILAQAKNGRLDKAQVDELKTHLAQLRQVLGGESK